MVDINHRKSAPVAQLVTVLTICPSPEKGCLTWIALLLILLFGRAQSASSRCQSRIVANKSCRIQAISSYCIK